MRRLVLTAGLVLGAGILMGGSCQKKVGCPGQITGTQTIEKIVLNNSGENGMKVNNNVGKNRSEANPS